MNIESTEEIKKNHCSRAGDGVENKKKL